MRAAEVGSANLEKILDKAKKDKSFRIALARQNHFWFFLFYFSDYLKYRPANMHREMFRLSEMSGNDLLVITAFRGSGKSSIMSLSLPIWAIVGKLNKRFVILSSQTQPQVKQIYENIKEELETNELLIHDFGPFMAKPWNDRTLKMLNYDAQILPVSLGSEIRGIRKRADRPDLVILDDIDSISSTKSQTRRDRTIEWFDRDIRQLVDKNTSFVVIGNLLHEECLVSILKQKITQNQLPGIYREYPLLTDSGKCLWPDKYPSKNDIEKLKNSALVESSWLREYLLKVFNDSTRILNYSDFQYYQTLPVPGDGSSHLMSLISVDPAISEKETADYTAVISGDVYRKDGKETLYIKPNFMNKRTKVTDTLQYIVNLYEILKEERLLK